MLLSLIHATVLVYSLHPVFALTLRPRDDSGHFSDDKYKDEKEQILNCSGANEYGTSLQPLQTPFPLMYPV